MHELGSVFEVWCFDHLYYGVLNLGEHFRPTGSILRCE